MARPLDALAREHAEDAIEALANIMGNDLEKSSDRIAAAKEILNRGHGTPKEAKIGIPLTREQAKQLAAMSDAELRSIIEHAPLPMLEAPEPAEEARDPLLD
jgi:hypothetical protein